MAATNGTVAIGPARAPVAAGWSATAPLQVLQSELSPATLWKSMEPRVWLFGRMAESGLGGPTYVAYSSPTGITALRPGASVAGALLRENWLLVGFPGAAGWTNWDSPWAVFLERRPHEVRLGEDGIELRFQGAAGCFSLLPLYGTYKPPVAGKEMLAKQGLKEKKLLTWEWPTAVARDPLVRLRYWAGATRHFPVYCEDLLRVDRGRDEVVLRQRFDWLDIPDEWGTKPIRVAPVSPTLGLVLTQGQRFPVRFSKAPFDFELPTPYGPYFGVPEVDSYDMTFPVLQYVNETESPVAVSAMGAGMPAVVGAALERLRTTAREKFPSPDRYQYDHGGLGNFCWAIQGDQWYAKALPYYDAATRSNAVASLRRYFREDVLVPERFVEREYPAGSGRRYLILEGPGIGSWNKLGDAGKFGANLLQTLWAYAHYTGDRELIRERWGLIRRLFTTPAETRWVGFGRDAIAELGDEAAPALAFARLAYLAGDVASYEYGCAVFARELVHLYAKQRGAAWFRGQQPWHSMESMDEEVFLTNLWGDLAGWQIDGPKYPATTGERQYENRWVRFQDLDVARFYREHLGTEVRAEMTRLVSRWEPARRFTDDSHIRPSLVRLHSFLMNAAPTNLAALATPEQFRGPASGVLASCLAVLRTAQEPKYERLIPGAPASGFVTGISREVPGPNPWLVQSVNAGGGGEAAAWPRVSWWGWKTPKGQPWNFGEVRVGDASGPPAVRRVALNWNTVRYEFTPGGGTNVGSVVH